MRFPFPPEEGAEDQSPKHQPRCHGGGHRPCHVATLIPGPPGAQSPRPAPAPPLAGASRPPGRALASAIPGPAGLRGTVPHGRGNAVRFLFPPGLTKALSPLHWQGPSPLPQRHADPWPAGGPKPPASARPAPGGRWPLLFPDLPVCGEPSRAGGETRCVSGSRPHQRTHLRRCIGRGYRPCHSARLIPGQPGAQSPRPAPAPPPAGAGLPVCLDLPVCGEPSRTGGGNAVRFLFRPAPTKTPSPLR
jgi:hypothetical protein